MVAIECRHLSKTYGRRSWAKHAVQDLTLTVQAHQVFGFLGPNGAGKTTTIRMLLDLVRPTQGDVRILGQPIRRNPTALQVIGALVEGASFYPYLSAWDNLRVYGWTMGDFNPHRAQALLEQMGLWGQHQAKVGAYSTGMRQKLGIVAALLNDPKVVILDEPTNGLDPAAINQMRAFIRRLADEEGRTVFLSSHLLGEVQQICDRVAIIHQGQLLAEGRVDDLLQQSPPTDEVIIELTPLDVAETTLATQWQVRRDQHAKTLIINAPKTDIPAIIRALVTAEVDIFALNYRQVSLEDVFLTMTTDTTEATSPDAIHLEDMTGSE